MCLDIDCVLPNYTEIECMLIIFIFLMLYSKLITLLIENFKKEGTTWRQLKELPSEASR